MLVDWVTVVAQAVNFIALVLLLRWLLFAPVTRMMEQRRAAIEQLVADARHAEAGARAQSERYETLRGELEARRQAELDRARTEAERWAAEAREQSRREVEELQKRWTDALLRERESFWREFETLLADEIYAAAATAITDLAATDLDAQIQRQFLTGLAGLDVSARNQLSGLAAGSGGGVVVLSAGELASTYRDQVTSAIRELLGPLTPVKFEVQPDLLAGVEIRGAGFKLGWSVRNHLDRLRGAIDSFLTSRIDSPAGGGSGDEQPETETERA